jgi:UDP-N-acetyl-2-amino-2-deoxyglucuronate dehydrogenase
MRAIRDVGGVLAGACDLHDSVGVLDSYNRAARFFTSPALFERWLQDDPPDYLVVCTPNYRHDHHVRAGLKAGCNVICEKPLTLDPSTIESLSHLERLNDRRVYVVQQLRLHPGLRELAERSAGMSGWPEIELHYATPRGSWYASSWKADPQKSGGLATNIGIHLFDALLWIFGAPQRPPTVLESGPTRAAGKLKLARGSVRWLVSIEERDAGPGGAPRRELTIPEWGVRIDLSDGFADAHTEVYREILAGRGFRPEDCRPALELCAQLR